MATTVARLQAVLSANTKDFDRDMAKSESRLGGMKAAAGAMGATLGIALGVQSVRAASDLNEEINKTNVVFGRSRESVLAWSETTATRLGLSQRAALEAAGAYGNMFQTIGLGDAPAAQMSKRMVQLAADMASFHNQDPSEMLLKLRSGLAGEAEPLRQFGVLISEARVKQEAYRLGIAKVGAQLTEQQKVQARYSLILRDSTKAHGDFERTSNSLANQQRVLRAQIENTEAVLGAKLLPVVLKLVIALNNSVTALEKVDHWMGKIGANQGLLDIFKKIGNNEEVQMRLQKISDLFKSIYEWASKGVDAIKSMASWLGKLHVPSIHLPHIGDPVDPNFAPPGIGGPKSISPRLYDELAGARAFGLTLTSGYRPGAVTKHGTRSDHSIYPSHAIDVAGPANRMAGFFRWLIGQTDVKQAFYDPLGSIFGGVLSSYREGGHSDHVHVATYDQGGFLRPGWNLAYNGTGALEPVGGGGGTVNIYMPNYMGSEQAVFAALQDWGRKHMKRNGRRPF